MVGPRADTSPGTEGARGKSPSKSSAGRTVPISQWPSVGSLVTGHGKAEEDLSYLLVTWGADKQPEPGRAPGTFCSQVRFFHSELEGCEFSTQVPCS